MITPPIQAFDDDCLRQFVLLCVCRRKECGNHPIKSIRYL